MISSVNNNLNQLTSELVAAKQNTKISTDSEGKEKVDTSILDSAPAPKTDTLEISPEGLAAAYAQTSTETSSSDASTMDSVGTPTVSSTEETESTKASSSKKDLSSYSSKELDNLVEDGTITKMGKNAELARHALEKSLENNQDKMLEQTEEGNGAPPPPKPEDAARKELPPVGDDLALTEGAATEDEE